MWFAIALLTCSKQILYPFYIKTKRNEAIDVLMYACSPVGANVHTYCCCHYIRSQQQLRCNIAPLVPKFPVDVVFVFDTHRVESFTQLPMEVLEWLSS